MNDVLRPKVLFKACASLGIGVGLGEDNFNLRGNPPPSVLVKRDWVRALELY